MHVYFLETFEQIYVVATFLAETDISSLQQHLPFFGDRACVLCFSLRPDMITAVFSLPCSYKVSNVSDASCCPCSAAEMRSTCKSSSPVLLRKESGDLGRWSCCRSHFLFSSVSFSTTNVLIADALSL